MKKPEDYETKKWLVEHTISGVKVHYFQTGTDTSDTDWEFFPFDGKPRRISAAIAKPMVDFAPDWVSLCKVKSFVAKEVDDWKKYSTKEKRDIAEFERLKKKFEAAAQ